MEAQVKFVRVAMWHGGQKYEFDVDPRNIGDSIRDFEKVLDVLRGLNAGMELVSAQKVDTP